MMRSGSTSTAADNPEMRETMKAAVPMNLRRAYGRMAAGALCAALCVGPCMAGGTPTVEPGKPGEPSPARSSAERAGLLQTTDGLTLRITTDLGSVKIVPL